ncbi:MAG: hypothetical protein HQM02_02720 [Magnetococcales bacterium]|nr:hypothetical protein [Magnetococcales bacterium]
MTLAPLLFSLLLILALVGSLVGLVLGAWLFLHPGASSVLDRSALETLRAWSRPVRVERFVYRHHRWFGGGIVLGSFFTLVALGGYAHRLVALARVGNRLNLEAWLWESLLLFVALGNFFTLASGLLILMRPSGLKGFEAWANRPVDPGKARQWLLAGLRNRPRVFALLLVASGTVSLFLLMKKLNKVW